MKAPPVEARVSQLAAEIERDWSQVEAHLARAESVDAGQGEPLAAYVALSLDHAYQAFETLLLRLERGLGLPERTGSAWHVQLLEDAKMELRGLRPPLYPGEVGRDWMVLLRFRHFLRHAYAVPLDPKELRSNVRHLSRAVSATGPGIKALVASLRRDQSGRSPP